MPAMRMARGIAMAALLTALVTGTASAAGLPGSRLFATSTNVFVRFLGSSLPVGTPTTGAWTAGLHFMPAWLDRTQPKPEPISLFDNTGWTTPGTFMPAAPGDANQAPWLAVPAANPWNDPTRPLPAWQFTPGEEVIFALFVKDPDTSHNNNDCLETPPTNPGMWYHVGPAAYDNGPFCPLPEWTWPHSQVTPLANGVLRVDLNAFFDGTDPYAGQYRVYDDFAFEVWGTTPESVVPEPMTMVLTASGLAGVALARRRSRRRD